MFNVSGFVSFGQIKIVKVKPRRWRVKYYGVNGKMLAHTEIFNSKQACDKNIQAMRHLLGTGCL